MGWMQNIVDAFSPGGVRGQQHQRFEEGLQQAQEQRTQQDADTAFHQHMLDIGASPVVNGVVKQTMYNPGNPDLGAPPTQGMVAQPVDKSRYIPSREDKTVGWQLPTTDEQQARTMHMQMLGASNPEAQQAADITNRRTAAAEEAKTAGVARGTEAGRQDALNTARQKYGLTLPTGAGVGEGTRVLPEEAAGVAQGVGAASELPEKIRSSQVAMASQQLGSVTSPDAYKAIYDRLPENVKPSFDAPEQFEPIKTQTRARMAAMSPDQQQKTSYLMNMTPQDWAGSVDTVAPPKGDTAALNSRTKTLVNSYLRRGEFDKADAAIKDAADQQGRTETAVRSAQATAPIRINVAGAEQNARNNANLNGPGGGSGSGSGGGGNSDAEMVANYQKDPKTAYARLPPYARKQLDAEVLKINPDFHQEYYNNFNKTETDATTGKIGTQANALNTMMGHLHVLNTAADALKNGDIQQLNKFANMIGAQTGSTPITTFNTIVHRLGPEVTKAYLAGGGSVGERGTNEADFDPALGPDQLKQNIGVSALLADSKIKALQDQYSRGTYGRGKQKLISDEAEQARQHLAGQAPANLRGGLTPTHTLHGRPIAVDPKTNAWVFVDDGKPAQ